MSFINKSKSQTTKISFQDSELEEAEKLKVLLLDYLSIIPENYIVELHIYNLGNMNLKSFTYLLAFCKALKVRKHKVALHSKPEELKIIISLGIKKIIDTTVEI